MHGEFRDADDIVVWREGQDYLTIDRAKIAKIVLVDDAENVIATVTPTGAEIPSNAMFRRRTTLSTTAAPHVVFVYGFPTTDQSPVYLYDNGQSSVVLDDSSALLRPVIPKVGEFTSPDVGGNALFSQAEINEYNFRSFNGPFKENGVGPVPGVPSTGYRGTWDEMVTRANNMTTTTWAGPHLLTNGRVAFHADNDPTTQGANNPTRQRALDMVCAAFKDLVRDTTVHRNTVLTHILNQAQVDRVQWDATYWGTWNATNDEFTGYNGLGSDTRVIIGLGNWLSMYAETLINYGDKALDFYTTAQRNTVMNWLMRGAEMLIGMSLKDLNNQFADWANGNYTPVSDWSANQEIGYFGSKPIGRINKVPNNRRANQLRYGLMFALAAEAMEYTLPGNAKFSLAQYKSFAKNWAKTWIMFQVYPEGLFGEMERWDANDPMGGIEYTGVTIAQPLTIAALLARQGDTELLDWTTTAGVHNWNFVSSRATVGDNTAGPIAAEGDPDFAGQGRGLQVASRMFLRYAFDFYDRYGTDQAGRVGNPNYKLRWANPADAAANEYVDGHAYWFADLNRYWQDPLINAVMERTQPGMPPMPPEFEQGFRLSTFHGDGHIWPSIIFQYFRLAANPYAGL